MAQEDGHDNEMPELLVVFIRILLAAQKPDKWRIPATTIRRLPALLPRLAQDIEQSDPDHELRVNYDHPGYLSRTIGENKVHVPFPIVRQFPNAATLRDLIRLANQVSVDQTSCIRISGSGAWLGGLSQVGDLDYCEYIFAAEGLPKAVVDLSKRRDADVALAIAKWPGDRVVRPWYRLNFRLKKFVAAALPADGAPRRLKLDYCVIAEQFGPLPASNVVLLLDPEDPEAGNARASFAHQEAVIDRGSDVVRTLIHEHRLGEYLSFLLDEIDVFLEAKPFKALKRTLSLCGILGLTQNFDPILELLNDPILELLNDEVSIRATRLGRIEDIEALVETLDQNEHPRLCRQFVDEMEAASQEQIVDEYIGEFESVVRDLVREVTETVSQLIDRVEHGDGPR